MKVRKINGKEVGQIAYEAYCEFTNWVSLVSGARLPAWNEQAGAIQNAWNVGAQAVLNHSDQEWAETVDICATSMEAREENANDNL